MCNQGHSLPSLDDELSLQARDEQREAAARALVLDGSLDSPLAADEDDFPLGPGDGRIKEITLEHDGMAVDQDHDDRVVFAALALVDGNPALRT